jgi:hypothetical protein
MNTGQFEQFGDLGIEGDDANVLMPEFFQRFSVELRDYDPYR